MTDTHTDGLEVPSRYEGRAAAAFRDGYAQALTHIGHGALSTAAELDTTTDPDADTDDETDTESDEEPSACATCGSDLLASLGAADSEHSPPGHVCPACDLGA